MPCRVSDALTALDPQTQGSQQREHTVDTATDSFQSKFSRKHMRINSLLSCAAADLPQKQARVGLQLEADRERVGRPLRPQVAQHLGRLTCRAGAPLSPWSGLKATMVAL